jgi:hypothetical protein
MRETTLNRGQGSTNFMKDVSMLILALEKLGVHIIFARIVASSHSKKHVLFLCQNIQDCDYIPTPVIAKMSNY